MAHQVQTALQNQGGNKCFSEGPWDGSRYGCVGILVFKCVAARECSAEDKLDMVSACVQMLAILCGGVSPVAGLYSFIYEGCIPL